MKLKSDFEGLIGKIKIPGADGQVSDLIDEIFHYYSTQRWKKKGNGLNYCGVDDFNRSKCAQKIEWASLIRKEL